MVITARKITKNREKWLNYVSTKAGKDTWSKRGIQTVLSNEKYIGNVLLGKTHSGDFPNNKQRKNSGEQDQFLMKDTHEPIIESKIFEKVQAERKSRSNIELINGVAKRKRTHYSTKSEKHG